MTSQLANLYKKIVKLILLGFTGTFVLEKMII